MNKTAQITNSVLALLVSLFLANKALAGQSITQAKVNQITPGLTTEEDLFRAFGAPTTKTVCPPGQVTLDWFYVSPISAQNYIPFIGPAFGGAQLTAWELWVSLRADGTVKRYIAYRHYLNGETSRYVERSDDSIQTDKNVRAGHF
jgi:outer membrane protein assembly factor BamE (lipoprotein component of BamABCDE complex)